MSKKKSHTALKVILCLLGLAVVAIAGTYYYFLKTALSKQKETQYL